MISIISECGEMELEEFGGTIYELKDGNEIIMTVTENHFTRVCDWLDDYGISFIDTDTDMIACVDCCIAAHCSILLKKA